MSRRPPTSHSRDIAAETLADMEPDRRKVAAHPVKKRLDQNHADRRRHPQIDRAGRRALGGFQVRLQPSDLLEQRAALLQHGAPDLGQFRAPSVAPKERPSRIQPRAGGYDG